MIFLFEVVPESIVRRYFLQVPALLNLPVPGFTVRVANTEWYFKNYYRPGLLFADFGDAKTLVRWTFSKPE